MSKRKVEILSHPIIRRTLIAGLAIFNFTVAGQGLAAEFEYSGDHGPGHWAEESGWETCGGAGHHQSPINIGHRVIVDPTLKRLDLHLNPTPIDLINNGHTIEEEYQPGSYLVFDSTKYNLAQFHFHALSEHTINGHHGLVELHSVFKDPITNKIAVVGMLFGPGRENDFIAKLLAAGLPEKKDAHIHAADQINLAEALTDTSSYFTYAGSLTTPPCSENVTWIVLSRPAEISFQQYQTLLKVLGNNFRPLQDLDGRVIRATRHSHHHRDRHFR